MREYYIFYIRTTAEDTKNKLNRLAQNGWKLICAYGSGNSYLIMERDKK